MNMFLKAILFVLLVFAAAYTVVSMVETITGNTMFEEPL